MELHKALRNIIQTDGQDVLKELRLVNILDDFNAYQDIPASKYILRAIIADGYTAKIMAIGQWNSTAESLANKFSTVTGFIPQSVYSIFQSIAYGLGWINNLMPPLNNNIPSLSSISNSTLSTPRQSIPTGWRKGMSDDEMEQYVLSLIDFDRSREKDIKVHMENLAIEVNNDETLTFSFELVRDTPKSYGYLCYAILDLRNRIKGTRRLGYLFPDDVNHKPVLTNIDALKIGEIGKIRLFWEN